MLRPHRGHRAGHLKFSRVLAVRIVEKRRIERGVLVDSAGDEERAGIHESRCVVCSLGREYYRPGRDCDCGEKGGDECQVESFHDWICVVFWRPNWAGSEEAHFPRLSPA